MTSLTPPSKSATIIIPFYSQNRSPPINGDKSNKAKSIDIVMEVLIMDPPYNLKKAWNSRLFILNHD
jgi:hypothetical protein